MDEIEWKWQIADQQAHQTLAQALQRQFGLPHHIPQCNRFFDTEDHTLRRLRMSVRLRRNGNQLVITAKRQRSVTDGLHRQWEWERMINQCCWQCTEDKPAFTLETIAPLPSEVRSIIGNNKLTCFGGFDNQRLEWNHQHIHIALDATYFNSQRTDYELEVEIPEANHVTNQEENDIQQHSSNYWIEFAREHGISLKAQKLTKLQRYVEQ